MPDKCLRLRVKDIDFDQMLIEIRWGLSIVSSDSAPHPPAPSPRKRGEGEMKVGLSGRAFGEIGVEIGGEMRVGLSDRA